jgi:hypothetical protein
MVEVIIAIVMFSIMMVMVFSFDEANVWQSVSPVINFRRAGEVQTGMDNVTRSYYNLPNPVTQASLLTFYNTLITPNQAAVVINATGVTVDTNTGRTEFITFPAAGGNQSNNGANPTPNLKVTLTNDQGQRVSTIFTKRQ